MALPAVTALWLGWIILLYFGSSNHAYYAASIIRSAPWLRDILNSFSFLLPAYWQTILAGSGSIPTNPVYGIVLTMVIIYACAAAYQKFFKAKKHLDLSLSPFHILLQFSLVFFITALSWFSFHRLEGAAPYPNILWHYPLLLVELIVIFLPLTALGWKVLERIKFTAAGVWTKTLLSLGIGTLLATQILWLLGLFGHLNAAWIGAVWLAIAVLCWQPMWAISKHFFQKKIVVSTPFGSPTVWLVGLLYIVLAHNILELIRPMPIGFDDLGLYMNIPKLLAGQGALLSGMDSYAWGLLMSLGFIFFQSTSLTLLLSCVGGILSLFAIYVVVEQYGALRGWEKQKSKFYALLASVIFYTLPSVVFQSSKDMKVDLAAVYFCLLALWLWWHMQTTQEPKKMNFQLLALIGLLAGFAFTIKYTAALFILALGAGITLSAFRARRNFLIPLVFFLFFAGLPFVPGAFKNVVETKSFTVATLLKGLPQSPHITFDPPLPPAAPGTITDTAVSNAPSGAEGELQRYIGFEEGWIKYLKLPFTVTLNYITSGMYVDIGFLFLAIIPLLLLVWVKHKDEAGKIQVDLLLMAGVFWILWGALAQGVIWYGYAGFLFLLLLLLEVYEALHHHRLRIPRFLVSGAILVWLVCALFLRTANLQNFAIYIDPTGLAYARGILNEQGYLERKIPSYLVVTQTINADIRANPEQPPKVYRIGTFMKYFIDQNNTLVLDDNQLDFFGQLYQEEDKEKFFQRLKNSGFKYIILDTNTPTIDKTSDKLVTRRFEDLLRIIQTSPTKIELILNTPQEGIIVGKIL